jgi:hypothetical protein
MSTFTKEPPVEVRCARCRGYLFSVTKGTEYRAYCRACGLKFEARA